jgi:hypothetical protein
MTAGSGEIVFVGGTGRSGTHILGRLLGCHSRWADVPIEARFHCNKRGMPDLLEGRIGLATFLEKLRGFWWHRVRVDHEPRGLYNLITRATFDAATDRFGGEYHADPVAACRNLFTGLLAGVAEEEAKPGLVEMSSHNIKEAQTLRRLFPNARFIHIVRDGRDAASSVTTKTWGPDRVAAGIDWWADRLRAIEDGVRGEEDGARYALPPDRLATIVLDDLVTNDRDAAYGRILDFLEADDEPAMRGFFDQAMGADPAHQGRWAEGLGRLGRERVRRKYERTLSALEQEGNHVAGPLLRAYESGG